MTIYHYQDDHWMREALLLAKTAALKQEVPIGAVIVRDHQIISQGYNCPISTIDPTAHAEIIALRNAARVIGNYRLLNTTLYVTLEPCIMCLGAMMHARINRLVFGAFDPKIGVTKTIPHSLEYTGGVLETACAAELKKFFQEKRL